MSATELLPYMTVFAAIVGVIYTALRFQRDDAAKAVETSGANLDQMKLLRDEALDALERCREEKRSLREALARASLIERDLKEQHDDLATQVRILEGREHGPAA